MIKNAINITTYQKGFPEAIGTETTEFIKNHGDKPPYIVLTMEQAEWFAENVEGKKIKMKAGQVLKLSGMSAITV